MNVIQLEFKASSAVMRFEGLKQSILSKRSSASGGINLLNVSRTKRHVRFGFNVLNPGRYFTSGQEFLVGVPHKWKIALIMSISLAKGKTARRWNNSPKMQP